MSHVPDRGLSTLAIIKQLEAEIAQLKAALLIIPAVMLLQAREPYIVQFTGDELRQIAAAQQIEV